MTAASPPPALASWAPILFPPWNLPAAFYPAALRSLPKWVNFKRRKNLKITSRCDRSMQNNAEICGIFHCFKCDMDVISQKHFSTFSFFFEQMLHSEFPLNFTTISQFYTWEHFNARRRRKMQIFMILKSEEKKLHWQVTSRAFFTLKMHLEVKISFNTRRRIQISMKTNRIYSSQLPREHENASDGFGQQCGDINETHVDLQHLWYFGFKQEEVEGHSGAGNQGRSTRSGTRRWGGGRRLREKGKFERFFELVGGWGKWEKEENSITRKSHQRIVARVEEGGEQEVEEEFTKPAANLVLAQWHPAPISTSLSKPSCDAAMVQFKRWVSAIFLAFHALIEHIKRVSDDAIHPFASELSAAAVDEFCHSQHSLDLMLI